jgi:hypothetical protein
LREQFEVLEAEELVAGLDSTSTNASAEEGTGIEDEGFQYILQGT